MTPQFKIIRDTPAKYTILMASGDLTAQHAEEFRKWILKSLKREGEYEVDLSDVGAIDVSAVQLLFIFKELIAKDSKVLKITMPKNKDILKLIDKTGIVQVL